MRYPLKLFLDTNVLVDLLEPREEFLEGVRRVFLMASFGDAELWASSSCMTDLYFILMREFRGTNGDIQRAILKLIATDNKCKLHIYAPQERDVVRALRYRWPDFEDCLVSVCAESVQADYIVTRDLKGFRHAALPSISPRRLLGMAAGDGLTYDEIEW